MASKVLVVDDSMVVRKQVVRALQEAGFATLEAGDGMEASEKLHASTDIGLVLCDVNMPRMSGLELLEQLSAARSPVAMVMLTTEGQPEVMERAKSLGAKGWIIKPFKPQLVIAAVKKLLAASSGD